MFLESLKIMGKHIIKVATIAINTVAKLALNMKKEMTNAAVANAIPTG